MLSVALLSFLLPAATGLASAVPASASATRAQAADPSVQLSLDRRDYEPGDRARVTVRVRDDGYLLVLRLSPDGYVRVLFPLDPGDDDFVRGDASYEIRGRGDRSAFTVSSSGGTGTVYAAWSTEPFRFDDYVLGDHWDYRVLDGSLIQGDPEAGLTELAQRMSTGHFDYDLVSYSVAREVAYSGTTHYVTMYPAPVGCFDLAWCGGYGSFLNVSAGYYGRHRFHAPVYDPFFDDPFFFDPFFYDPFFFPSHFRYGRHFPVSRGCFGCRISYPTVVVINPRVHRGSYGYQWKPGSYGGGGRPGVIYRPRGSYASNDARATSPLFVASKYRRVAGDAGSEAVSRQRPGSVFGVPVTSGSGARAATVRREPGRLPEVIRGEVGRTPATPRRGGEAGEAVDGRGSTGSRVSPRIVDGVGAGSPATSGRRVDAPRSASPRPSAEPRSEPRQVEPRRVEPRTIVPTPVAPRREEPRQAAPQRVQPQAVRAEPRPEPRAEPRRVEARPQPTRVERPEPMQRSQPRAEPRASQPRASQPRSSPAPRMSQPRSAPAPRASQPRSAPAPRAESGRSRRP